jgi:FAD/FMN-containing dehydrogenase
VLADGRIIDCDEGHHADLFWALRGGGGGQFAVVTRLEFRTLPAPTATGFHQIWPWREAAAVVDAWQRWAPHGPDGMAASLVVRSSGDPGRPPTVLVFGAVLEHETDARSALDEFIASIGIPPTRANHFAGSYCEVKRYLGEYDIESSAWRPFEREAGHSYSRSEYFRRELPAEVIAELLSQLAEGRSAGETRVLDFTPWGGAYNRVSTDATAFVHRDERFLLKQEVIIDGRASAGERRSARTWLTRSWELVHPWGSGGVYPNFPDPELDDEARAYYGTNLPRLRRVKATYDPENLFRFEQSIPPA